MIVQATPHGNVFAIKMAELAWLFGGFGSIAFALVGLMFDLGD